MLTKLVTGAIVNLPHRSILKRSDGLEITYKNNKIKKVCTDAKTAERAYGREMAERKEVAL